MPVADREGVIADCATDPLNISKETTVVAPDGISITVVRVICETPSQFTEVKVPSALLKVLKDPAGSLRPVRPVMKISVPVSTVSVGEIVNSSLLSVSVTLLMLLRVAVVHGPLDAVSSPPEQTNPRG